VFKVDAVTQAALPGASFSLRGSDGCTNIAISDESGIAQFCIAPCVSYVLTEVSPPVGYERITTTFTVTADKCGNILVNNIPMTLLRIPNQPTGSLFSFTVTKIDSLTSLPVAGAVFELSRNGTALGTATSSAAGLVTFAGLASGAYTMTETVTPTGYNPNPTVYSVVVAANGSVTINGVISTEVEIPNTPLVTFLFTKIDADTELPLAGATFQLSQGGTPVDTATSSVTGAVSFENLAIGTYTLTEIVTPDGYEENTTVYTVVVDAAGTITVNGVVVEDFTIGNTPEEAVSFSKIDADTELPLAGAVFTLSQGGTVSGTAVSNGAGNVTFEDVVPGTYTLTEIVPPSGYNENSTIYTVVVAADGSATINGVNASEVEISNTPLVTFLFTKVDADTELPLAGATFQLAQGGTPVDAATSNVAGLVSFDDIAIGTYTLTEIVAPDGYDGDPTVYTIAVDAEGTITVNGVEVEDFTVENDPIG